MAALEPSDEVSRSYISMARPLYPDCHAIVVSGSGAGQRIFLDYFALKGVKEITIESRVGEPLIAHITLYIGSGAFVEPEKD